MEDPRRETLVRMFPDYDVDVLLASLTNATVEQIADWCLNNPQRVPTKRRAEKRKHSEPAPSSPASQEDSDSDLEFDDIADGLILDRLVKEMLNKLKKEMSVQDNKSEGNANEIKYLLSAIYPKLRCDFLRCAYQESGFRLFASLIIGFFVSNKLTQRLHDEMPNPQSNMWVMTDLLKLTRKKNTLDIFDGDISYYSEAITTPVKKFVTMMNALAVKYPGILERLELLPDAFQLRLEVPDDIEKFDCGVCFCEYTITRRIMCGTGQSTDEERHSFCRNCVKQQAQAATEEMPLAEGGIGLKCMAFKCAHPILYSAVRNMIPKKVRRKIDERIMEENIGNSGLNLERCRECNFAIEMEESKEENKVFSCPNCEKNWCRLCEREWDGDHFGISCAELDDKNKVDKKQRELERRLNEAVIRKCKCGLQFTKSDGCNKMTCRCGKTQCYLCRQEGINYTHFCQHVRIPGNPQQCQQCDKKCTLWADANQLDQQIINQIRAENGAPADTDVAGPSRPRVAAPPIRPPQVAFHHHRPAPIPPPVPMGYGMMPQHAIYHPPAPAPMPRQHQYHAEGINFGFQPPFNLNVNFDHNFGQRNFIEAHIQQPAGAPNYRGREILMPQVQHQAEAPQRQQVNDIAQRFAGHVEQQPHQYARRRRQIDVVPDQIDPQRPPPVIPQRRQPEFDPDRLLRGIERWSEGVVANIQRAQDNNPQRQNDNDIGRWVATAARRRRENEDVRRDGDNVHRAQDNNPQRQIADDTGRWVATAARRRRENEDVRRDGDNVHRAQDNNPQRQIADDTGRWVATAARRRRENEDVRRDGDNVHRAQDNNPQRQIADDTGRWVATAARRRRENEDVPRDGDNVHRAQDNNPQRQIADDTGRWVATAARRRRENEDVRRDGDNVHRAQDNNPQRQIADDTGRWVATAARRRRENEEDARRQHAENVARRREVDDFLDRAINAQREREQEGIERELALLQRRVIRLHEDANPEQEPRDIRHQREVDRRRQRSREPNVIPRAAMQIGEQAAVNREQVERRMEQILQNERQKNNSEQHEHPARELIRPLPRRVTFAEPPRNEPPPQNGEEIARNNVNQNGVERRYINFIPRIENQMPPPRQLQQLDLVEAAPIPARDVVGNVVQQAQNYGPLGGNANNLNNELPRFLNINIGENNIQVNQNPQLVQIRVEPAALAERPVVDDPIIGQPLNAQNNMEAPALNIQNQNAFEQPANVFEDELEQDEFEMIPPFPFDQDSDNDSLSENDDEEEIDVEPEDDNNGEDFRPVEAVENELIDLTEVEDDVPPVGEMDLKHIERIHDKGERFEVMPIDMDSQVQETRQLDKDWDYVYKLVAELQTSNQKMRETVNINDTGREQEKRQTILGTLDLHDEIANLIMQKMPQVNAQTEMLNNL